MSNGILRHRPRVRRHGAVLQPVDRRELERAGWRTTLDYRENHERSVDGRLLRVAVVWVAVAERYDVELTVVTADGATADAAWAALVSEIAAARAPVFG